MAAPETGSADMLADPELFRRHLYAALKVDEGMLATIPGAEPLTRAAVDATIAATLRALAAGRRDHHGIPDTDVPGDVAASVCTTIGTDSAARIVMSSGRVAPPRQVGEHRAGHDIDAWQDIPIAEQFDALLHQFLTDVSDAVCTLLADGHIARHNEPLID